MLYPYERYLTVLILKGTNNLDITRKISSLGQFAPSNPEIDEKRSELLAMFDKKDAAKVFPPLMLEYKGIIEKYMPALKTLGVDELLPALLGNRIPEWEEVLYLATDGKIRLAIPALSLYGYSQDEIKHALKNKFGHETSSAALELYLKYIWDIKRISKLELHSYIDTIPYTKIRTALFDALHKRGEVLKWTCAGENVVDLRAVLVEVMNEAFAKFKTTVQSDDPKDVAFISKWADLAIKAAEKFEKLTGASKRDTLTQLQFELEKMRQSDIPTMDKNDREIV